jgi:ribonuclease P/MRP protein subunit POP1
MAFLPSLIHTGTRVGGQRERQTQAFESSMPFFPRDYPSTGAYNDLASKIGALEKERWDKKPKAKKPAWDKLGVRSPWKPDWDVVLGLKEPQPLAQTVDTDEDLLPTDRSEDLTFSELPPVAQTNNYLGWREVDGQDKEDTCHPWLLRGTGVVALLTSLAAPTFTHASRLGALMQFIDGPRIKRNIPQLAAQVCGRDPPRMSQEQTYQSALVRVALRLWGKGCPSDMAIIHEMTDEELLAFTHKTTTQKRASLMQVDLEETDVRPTPILFQTSLILV